MSFTEYHRKDEFQNQLILRQMYGHFANNLQRTSKFHWPKDWHEANSILRTHRY